MELPNGIRIFEDIYDSREFFVAFGVKYDSVSDVGRNRFEILHFLEHLLFPPDERLENLKIDVNSTTFYKGMVTAFRGKKGVSDKFTDILIDKLFSWKVDERIFELEKNRISREISCKNDDIAVYSSGGLISGMYNLPSCIGMLERVKDIKSDDLLDEYERVFIPKNMCFYVGGGYSPSTIQKLTEKLTALRREGENVKERKISSHLTRLAETRELFQAYMTIGFDLPILEKHLFEVTNSLLTPRLYKGIVDREDLSYKMLPLPLFSVDFGLLLYHFGISSDDIEKAEGIFFDEIEKSKKTPLSKKEFNHIKSEAINDYEIYLQSMEAAEDFVMRALYGYETDSLTNYRSKVRNLTGNEILNYINQFIDKEKCGIIVIKPK